MRTMWIEKEELANIIDIINIFGYTDLWKQGKSKYSHLETKMKNSKMIYGLQVK